MTSGSTYSFAYKASTGNAFFRYNSTDGYSGGTLIESSTFPTSDLYFKLDYLPNDYVLSNGTTKVYTALNNGWNQDITAIARDDASDLDQRKSKSTNSSSVVTL